VTTTQVGREVTQPVGRHGGPGALQADDVQGRLTARRRQIASLRRVLLFVDVVATACVVVLGVATGHRVAALMAGAVCAAVVAHVHHADGPRSIVSMQPVVRSAVMLSGVAALVSAALGSSAAARELPFGAAGACAALLSVRVVVHAARLESRFGLGGRRRLIVGDPQTLASTAARRAPEVEAGEVILVVTREERAGSAQPHRIGEQRRGDDDASGPSGLVQRIARTALDNHVARVTIIPGSSWQQRQLRELSWLLEDTGIDMVISTSLDGIAPHRVAVVQQEGRLMIKVGSASPRGSQALVKSASDRLGAALLLALLTPLLLLIALAIRLDSPGPAIFRQTRVREGGAHFTMLKFRSMHVDAEKQLSRLQELNKHGESRQLFKIEDDPRITRIGHLLRKTSLDELPQLFNVLRGQMSLIGPRPALPLEVEMYDYVARRRLHVKPGMTGLWQVSGRSRLSWDESIGFDLDYVDNWSPATDAAIAMRTFRAVLSKDGAY
jgi:exopolysaccharide biosynthesis polyprenyl glycosylphosphotransferase